MRPRPARPMTRAMMRPMMRRRFIGPRRGTAVMLAGLVAVALMWATTVTSGRAASIEIPTVHLGVEVVEVTP